MLAVSLNACGTGKKSGSKPSSGSSSGTGAPTSGGKPITIGTTDQVIALDPAGSYDNGSTLLETNVYQYLMSVPQGSKKLAPDAAQSCGFTNPKTYTCTLKANQKFSNGDVMTAKDVGFSYQRIIKINNPNGPASLLANMKSVAAKGTNTV
ncbi:MAG: ABC transporter substrate-binding protein, partial [Actinomycetota bacterium]|nr:ABC transporter substrate-binding protein [Actinomycetota bacterium]